MSTDKALDARIEEAETSGVALSRRDWLIQAVTWRKKCEDAEAADRRKEDTC